MRIDDYVDQKMASTHASGFRTPSQAGACPSILVGSAPPDSTYLSHARLTTGRYISKLVSDDASIFAIFSCFYSSIISLLFYFLLRLPSI